MPRILIPDAESRHTLNVMHCLAREEGVEIFLLSRNKMPYCKFSKFCNAFITHSFNKNDVEFLDLVIDSVKRFEIDYLFPIDTEGTIWVSEHSKDFEGVCETPLIPNKNQIQIVTDKWDFFCVLKNKGVHMPKTECLSHVVTMSFPVLMKPKIGESGKGIELIHSKKEFDGLQLENEGYIVQEFIDGYDIDCSFLSKDGELLAYTVQKPLRGKKDGFDFSPSKDIEMCHEERVVNIIRNLVHELDWNGVAHADLRYCQKTDDFYLIEINPRYWSTLLGSLAAGVNFPRLALNNVSEIPQYKALFYYGIKSKLKSFISSRSIDKPVASTLKHVIKDPLPFMVNKLIKLV